MVDLILVIIAVLGLSAICSLMEAALFSVSLIEIQKLALKENPLAVRLLEIRKNPAKYINTIVILNNISNISGSIIIGKMAADRLGSEWLGVFSAVLTFTVIVFSEIIPKTYGEQHSLKLSLMFLRPLIIAQIIFAPLTIILDTVLLSMIKKRKSFKSGETEIKLLTRLGHLSGMIEDDEAEMIYRVFKMNDLTASDIMTPRVVMTTLQNGEKLEKVKEKIIESQHNRIVVIDRSPDEVSGFVLKLKLLQEIATGNGNCSISDYLIDPIFIPETKKVDSLLELFLKQRNHIAVVIDEYGGVSGVVTLEDVIEVITGQIVDETDQNDDMRKVALKYRKKII